MSAVISGELRREKILATLSAAEAPLSGSALGRACEVSRQVVVQDIALLREIRDLLKEKAGGKSA